MKRLLFQEFLSISQRLCKPRPKPLNQELLEQFYLKSEDKAEIPINKELQGKHGGRHLLSQF